MGQIEISSNHALSEPGPTALQPMRIHDLVVSLNQAGLGNVIGERQLHRHRIASQRCFEIRIGRSLQGTRIDVLRYFAWLVDRVHADGSTPICGEVTYAGVFNLLERQRYRCALSGRVLTPETASLDHRIPVSRGGPHRMENAQVLHADINRAKASLTDDEFIALCREVVAWADRTISN